ncbi:MAG: alpha/beta hydrolase [Rhodobacteraceae bacterium]|nr:alpha/beta hydrolase [Paracoccaceae bacterium]
MDPLTAYDMPQFIPDADAYPDRWADEAAAWRSLEAAIGRARLNQPYGPHDRHRFDLFYPAGRPAGLVVYVHGGYWRRFDRKLWSHFAAGATASGWAVAMPSYPLAPEARIAEITSDIARAIAAAADLVGGPLILTGHSAGGHLVARMAEARGPLPGPVAARLQCVVPISPLGDLRPLLAVPINTVLHLDMAEAVAESPALRAPRPGLPVTIWVGAEERPVFLDQAMDLAAAWNARLRMAPGCHHFDVIDGLCVPDSPLTRSLFTD